MSDEAKAKASEAKANKAKANEAKANEAKANEERGRGPVSQRALEKEDESVEETVLSAEIMQNIIDTNKRMMSADTKAKFDAYQLFVKANPGMVIETHDDFDLQFFMLPGSYRNPEKPSEFLNTDFLPGTVMIKSLVDAKAKIRLPFTQLIILMHRLKPFMDKYPEIVSYNVSLEREANMRKVDVDVLEMGK